MKNLYVIPRFPSIPTSDLLPRLIKNRSRTLRPPSSAGPNPLNCLAIQSSLPITSPGNLMAPPTPAALPYLRWSLQWLMQEGGGDPAVDPSPRSISNLQPVGATGWQEPPLLFQSLFAVVFGCAAVLQAWHNHFNKNMEKVVLIGPWFFIFLLIRQKIYIYTLMQFLRPLHTLCAKNKWHKNAKCGVELNFFTKKKFWQDTSNA